MLQNVYLSIALFLISLNALAQNVGVNNTNPLERLDVIGNVKVSDTLKANNIQIPTAAADGAILTSDAQGNGSWKKANTSVTGYVKLLDFYGNPIVAGLAGISVNIEGTSITATTDSTGKFTFLNLPTNNYTFVASKTGFGTDKLQSTAIEGAASAGNYIGSIKLSQLPTFNPSSVTGTLIAGDMVLSGSLTGITNYKRTVAVFINTNNTVSANTSNYIYFAANNVNAGNNNYTIAITAPMMAAMGIASGTTLYCKVYSINLDYANSSSYTDLVSGKKVYSAVGAAPSNVYSFVKP